MQQEAMVVQLTPAMCPPFAENEKNEEKKKTNKIKKKTQKGMLVHFTPAMCPSFAENERKQKRKREKDQQRKKTKSDAAGTIT